MHANYKSYLETVLSYGPAAINSHLKTAMFYPDKVDNFDKFEKESAAGEQHGFQTRFKLTKASKPFQVMFKPGSDLLAIDKVFPPDTEVKLRFTRASDAFVLCADTATINGLGTSKFRVHIEKAELYVDYVTLRTDVIEKHVESMQKEYFTYPMPRTQIKTFVFPSGIKNLPIHNAFNGILPRQLFITMIDSEAFNGNYAKNPYKFANFDISTFCIRKNGIQIPSTVYATDFSNDLYMRLFHDTYNNIGIYHSDAGTLIDPIAFKNSYCILSLDLTNDGCSRYHKHPEENGTLDIDLNLGTALTGSTTVVLFAYTDGVLYLDKWRNVQTDFAM